MAEEKLGRNITFPIYNEDGTSFQGLVLRKAVVDSVVMSLGDKITGDVYYKDNTLDVTMKEYIIYKRNPDDENEDAVRYVLVSPPTIVREGMVSDNSELKGMTKYSFVFYHPMYALGNLPFTDVAVTENEERFLSQDKEFSWIGYPDDYIAKLNKNLQGTQWMVEKSSRFPLDKDTQLSGVLTFSKNTIADALKTWYDTWEIPYVIDAIGNGEQGYSDGKRFKVVLGLPSNEIHTQEDETMPYIFRMGKGVGLKNNSRTPRNNKIVTRISGYGSESNIPYGYPQIIWQGNQEWDYTLNNASGVQTITIDGESVQAVSYPIYDGIVGGRKVRLIKHPFTRSTLMPTVYRETVDRKVNPLNPNYNPNGEIIDYYDAVPTEQYPYPNAIDTTAPSYEIHQFEDIKPEMNTSGSGVEIVGAVPLNADLTPADAWDDTMDDDGNYLQSYFRVDLPLMSFDIYACASITEQMSINMRSGACIGCTFNVQVDWEDYKKNFYNSDGVFDPVIHTTSGDGHVRDGEKYPDSSQTQISLIVQKDNETFGTLMPNVYQIPRQGDEFVVLGISLPVEYITGAEQALDDAAKSYMLENNVHYYDYPLKFDEYFLATHTYILSQIKPNAIVHFAFGNMEQPLELYVKQLTIKYGAGVLPQYDITLTDNIEVVLNQIGQVVDDVERLSSVISILRETYSRNVWVELAKKLSKTNNDTAYGHITFDKETTFRNGLESNDFVSDASGFGITKDRNGSYHIETDYLKVRQKAFFKEVEVQDVYHVGGQMMLTSASAICDFVVDTDSAYRCYFRKTDGDGRNVKNLWKVGDQAYVNTFNLVNGENADSNHMLWRLVTGIDTEDMQGTYTDANGNTYDLSEYHYIDLSKSDCALYSDAPLSGDNIVQLGYRNGDSSRESAIVIAGAGDASAVPYIYEFAGITSYSLPEPVIQISPNGNVFSGKVTMKSGSSIEDGALLDEFTYGKNNLLRNSGFNGNYSSIDVSNETDIEGDTQMYSPSFEYWSVANAVAQPSTESESGVEVVLNGGTLSQALYYPIKAGDDFILTFKGKGTQVTFSAGGVTQTIPLGSEYMRNVVRFQAVENGSTFIISNSTCTICELQLERGTIASTSWGASSLDNRKELAEYQNLAYLKNAMHNGNTSIIGGLILSSIIQLGNYVDGRMQNVTAGMSGIYNNDNDVSHWAGGTFEQAINTVLAYAGNPNYQPTEEEVENFAKFVVTHGGRAILNDVILRGYIYALGGVFRGTVYAQDGEFNGRVNASSGVFRGTVYASSGEFSGLIRSHDGEIGGFQIRTDSLQASLQGGKTMVLAPANIIFTDSTYGVMSKFGSGSVEDSTAASTLTNPLYIRVLGTTPNIQGIYLSVSGGTINDAVAGSGNSAISIAQGKISGLRANVRRVNESQTLSTMDSVIINVAVSPITLTLPADAEDGQMYWIQNYSVNGGTTLAIASGSGQVINDGKYNSKTSWTHSTGEMIFVVYDSVNKAWHTGYFNCN